MCYFMPNNDTDTTKIHGTWEMFVVENRLEDARRENFKGWMDGMYKN